MNTTVEHEFLEILRKTCRTMRQARNRPEMAIPAAEWEMKINSRLAELDEKPDETSGRGDHQKAA